MPTIVFAPAVFNLVETTRMIEIAKQLPDTYHCDFIGFSSTFAPLITAAGFEYHLLSPVLTIQQEKQIIAFDQGKSFKNPFTKRMAKERVASELAFLTTNEPQSIVTGSNVTIFLSARIKDIPLIYVKPYALSGPFLADANTPIPISLQRLGPLKKPMWSLIRQILAKITWKPTAFKKTAAAYGLQLPHRSHALMDGDLNLITTPALFMPDATLPVHYRIVGPIFANLNSKLPDEVLTFIQQPRQQGKKIMYLAMGSSGDPKILQKILHYLSGRADIAVIAPIKKLLDRDTEIHPQWLICDYLPTSPLKDWIDFSFIHGGEGTVQTACASGKPFIAIGMQYEQHCHIAACVEFGNAVELTKLLTHKKIAAALQALAPMVYDKARLLKQYFHVEGAAHAAAIIVDLSAVE